MNARFVLIFGVSLVPPLSLFQQYDLPDFWYCQARSFAATVNTGFLLFSVRCVAANVVARFLLFASKVFCRHYECQIFANSAARAFQVLGGTWMECPCGGLGWNALAADLDGMPLWQHGADLDGMPLRQTWMECPCGRLGWNALAADLDGMPLWWHGADLDGMPLRRTWMECPSGGLGWDALVAAWGGLGWNALVADLDGMP